MTTRREEFLARAKQLAAAKDQALNALIDATLTVADISDQLAAAQGDQASRFRDAIKAGWTDDELAKIGIDLGAVAGKPGRKQRAKKTVSTPPAAGTAAASSARPVVAATA